MARAITAFFLGGTISMAGPSRLGADELVDAVPQLAELDVALDARQFRSVPSAWLTADDIVELVAAAAASAGGADGGADGIVVVQGTDTIEETAYLIDLLWREDAPVVITGAMRNPTLAGADGPANLLAAVAVAASDRFAGMGALVAFNDEVHAARFVRKTHTSSPSTFASPDAGPIGRLVENVAVRTLWVDRRTTYSLTAPVTARVALVTVGFDDAGETLNGLDQRCDGVVVAGLGAGHVPERLADTLAAMASRLPIVLASRAGAGPVLSRSYAFRGSESDLLERGLIRAGLLDPLKSRTLLRVLLANGRDRSEIVSAFAEASGVT